jgi:hypothetical protein
MMNINRYFQNRKRKPQLYKINYNTSKLKFDKDLRFKLRPQDIGSLFNKYSEIYISQVDAEIYLEFERSLSPL